MSSLANENLRPVPGRNREELCGRARLAVDAGRIEAKFLGNPTEFVV